MIFISQQSCDDLLVERKPNIFICLSGWHTIIRHDCSSVHFECCFKRNEVIIEIITRINLSFLKWEMRVQAFFLRAATAEMFGHACYTIAPEFLALKSEYICFGHSCSELSIFSKCSADARPAWFG